MTQKELLYMEDAISHGQVLEIIFQNFCGAVEDEKLKDFLTKLAKKNQTLEEKLMKVMEDAKDEG